MPTDSDLDRALWALSAYDTTALGTTGPDGPHVAGVFFAPERSPEGGLRLLTAMLRGSRKHREIEADARVAFMCSPGHPARWIQGYGTAVPDDDGERRTAIFARLLEHAPGARPFVENLDVLPVVITVRALKVVEDPGSAPFELRLGPNDRAA